MSTSVPTKPSALQICAEINAAYQYEDNVVVLPDSHTKQKSEVDLITMCRMIARYQDKASAAYTKDINEKLMRSSVRDVLVETNEYDSYVSFRLNRVLMFDEAKLCRLVRRVSSVMLEKDKLEELIYCCHTKDGRKRKRLLGGGRRSRVPEYIKMLVYARMTYYTQINGSFTVPELKRAFRDYSHAVLHLNYFFINTK